MGYNWDIMELYNINGNIMGFNGISWNSMGCHVKKTRIQMNTCTPGVQLGLVNVGWATSIGGALFMATPISREPKLGLIHR